MSNNGKLAPKLRFPEFRDDWNDAELNDVAVIVGERVSLGSLALEDYVSTENILSDFGGITHASNLPSTGSVTRFRINDVLVSNIRPYLNKVWAADRDGGASNDVIVIRVKPVLRKDFFACVLKSESFIAHVMRGAKGVKMPRGDIGLMMEYSVPYPSPAEQRMIADCLSSLDDLIAAEGRKLESLRAYENGLMQQLFPRDGEATPRLRFPEFRDKGEWSVHALKDIAEFRRGSFPQPYGLPEWYDDENGKPFVQVFDVDENFRLKSRTKSQISELAAAQSVFIPQGTLLVTLQGSIGRVAITQYDAYVDRTLLLFERFLKPLAIVFFAYVVHNLFETEKVKAPGGIIKTITKEVLSDFEVKLPVLAEQNQIAACLSSLDDQIAAQSRKIDRLKQHKHGLMQQLFPSAAEAEA